MEKQLISEETSEELEGVCRAVVGDELRSITYFTPEHVEQVYLRSDLEQTADLVGFAEFERLGFQSHLAYKDSQLGEYRGTIRMFENGYLTRIIAGEHGIWVTTDDMSIDRFHELVTALTAILSEFDSF